MVFWYELPQDLSCGKKIICTDNECIGLLDLLLSLWQLMVWLALAPMSALSRLRAQQPFLEHLNGTPEIFNRLMS